MKAARFGDRVFVRPFPAIRGRFCYTGSIIRARATYCIVRHDDGRVFVWSMSELCPIGHASMWKRIIGRMRRVFSRNKPYAVAELIVSASQDSLLSPGMIRTQGAESTGESK